MEDIEIPNIISSESHSASQTKGKRSFRLERFGKKTKILVSVVGLMIVLAALLFISVGLPLMAAYKDGTKAIVLAQEIKAAAKVQDIKKTNEAVLATKTQLLKVEKDLAPIVWTKSVPFVGSYSSDMFHMISAGKDGLDALDIVTKAIEPYADLLGLKGQGTFAGGTTEDRIVKAVETLDKIVPELDKVAEKLDLIKKELDPIDPNRYPETLKGKIIRANLVTAKEVVTLSDTFLQEARPLARKLPELLGVKGESKYLIVFQNDKEIRPTGGFMTAYAVFRVEKGKIHLEASDDIYKLDNTVTKSLTPPEPISKYLNVHSWRLRDANFSPDFVESMKTFEALYNSSTDKKKLNGIIAVDTHVLLAIMDVIGPVNAYGTTFTTKKVPQCDCPMIIYELEKFADEPKSYERGSRKDIIGVLLSEILKKTLSAPKQLLGQMVPVGWTELANKHILVFFHDIDAQLGMEAINGAGRIKPTPGGTDYLHINDANLGGAKSNLYVKEKVNVKIETGGSQNVNTVEIMYQYPRLGDNCSLERKEGLCLAGIYRDYLRVYLPQGAKLIEAKGFESKNTVFEDLGHTVVDGFFTLVPQGVATIKVQYSVPFKLKDNYHLFVQKQPGMDTIPYKVTVDGKTVQTEVITDTEIKL